MSDLYPTLIVRWDLLPRISSPIADPEAQHCAAEVYFAAVDQLFSDPDLRACDYDRTPRPEVPAAGTYVCVFSPRSPALLPVHHEPLDGPAGPRHRHLVELLRMRARQRGPGVDHLAVNGPSGRLTLTGFKTCPTCGGIPTLD